MKWRSGVAVAVLVVVAGLVAAILVVPRLGIGLGSDTVDRSQPALLKSLRDLSQYHASAGEFQVVLDIERDVRYVPSALAGQRTLFVAAGTVNAYVDFGGLAENALKVSPTSASGEARQVELALPGAVLDKPNLDQERSYVFAQERGLIDRLASLVETQDQQPFYVAAEQKIADAARESGLVERADDNTRKMLTGMFGALGYEVRFTDPT